MTTQKHTQTEKNIFPSTIGIYPMTSLGGSFYHHSTIDQIICRKDGITAQLFKKDPFLNIDYNNKLIKHPISEKYSNGIVKCFKQNKLPSVIICTPCYEYLDDLTNEIADLVFTLIDQDIFKAYQPLSRLLCPTFILGSNGIIYDETLYKIKEKLKAKNIEEKAITKALQKVVRASIMQGAYRDKNIYYPNSKGLMKIALPKFELFGQISEALNSSKLNFSINKNPYRIEFEKAMISIATNTAAIAFAIDEQNLRLKRIDLHRALNPIETDHAVLTNSLQKTVFNLGKKAGAFNENDTFENIWNSRKEQILKHDSSHISSSMYNLKHIIKTGCFLENLPPNEKSLIYPLKRMAEHYNLLEELASLKKVEQRILFTIDLAYQNYNKITFTF